MQEVKQRDLMPDQHKAIPSIPRETARMAKAVFGRSNFYILVGEQLENMLDENQLRNMPGNETEGMVPILPLVTFFQFIEGLTDVQSEDAVRTRLDWKFALHMAINAPSFSHTALCEFRQNIARDVVSQREFQRLVEILALVNADAGKETGPAQAPAVLSAVCSTNRLYWILEAMSQILEYFAGRYPEWLREIALPHWYMRYQTHDSLPRWNSTGDLLNFIHEAGTDIAYLLESVSRLGNAEIKGSREIRELNRVWSQQFERVDSQTIRALPHCSFCVSTNEIKSIGKPDSTKEGLLNHHN
jgi:hypothetical protein